MERRIMLSTKRNKNEIEIMTLTKQLNEILLENRQLMKEKIHYLERLKELKTENVKLKEELK